MPPKREKYPSPQPITETQELPIPEELLHDEFELSKYLWDYINSFRCQTNKQHSNQLTCDNSATTNVTNNCAQTSSCTDRSTDKGTGEQHSSNSLQPKTGHTYTSLFDCTRQAIINWSIEGDIKDFRREISLMQRIKLRDSEQQPQELCCLEGAQTEKTSSLNQFQKDQQKPNNRHIRRFNYFKYQKKDHDHWRKQQQWEQQQLAGCSGQAARNRGRRTSRGHNFTSNSYK